MDAASRHPDSHRLNVNAWPFSRSRGDSSLEPVQDPRFSVHADGTLEISGARVEDAGRYTCLGKNTEGTSDIRATLHVKGLHPALFCIHKKAVEKKIKK